jgi:peptide/nickel transport system substrate-binding protein
MHCERERFVTRRCACVIAFTSCTFLLSGAIGCGSASGPAANAPVVLRVGVNLASGNAFGGVRQVASNQSFEGLVRLGPDGRPQPWLARSSSVAADNRSMTFSLRRGAKFSDGSPVDAATLVQSLKQNLASFLGPEYQDIQAIESSSDGTQITVSFRRPSRILPEALEVPIRKPGATGIGTGPFVLAGTESAPEIHANNVYYLGRPIIDSIVVTNYPTIRAAWAEMLRNNIDMLYEVSADAAASLQQATTVATFKFVRWYQYVIILNARSAKFRAPAVRRALNAAIDRSEVVRDGFDGHATPATGLLWPQNWAYRRDSSQVIFDPTTAAAEFRSRPKLTFTCLVPTDYERVALDVQRQLAAVGVTMNVEPTTADLAFKSLASPTFEAALMDIVGGPGLLRTYELWHSKGSTHLGAIDSPQLDAALDRVRTASSDDEYRAGVAELQRVTTDDPPAIYLAWGERSRAISKRFDVPVEPGRDVLSTLRLWKPVAADRRASRN